MNIKRIIKAKMNRQKDLMRYRKTRDEYISQCGSNDKFCYKKENEWSILAEYRQEAGFIDEHYFFQDIYVARHMATNGYKYVYDIGSRVDGYISHLLAMDIKVTMIDVRPLNYDIEGLDFIQGNATDLNTIPDNSLEVLSSLHAVEHFGLGRYGDPVDYSAWEKALKKMQQKVKYGGILCVSAPVGKEDKLMFNAHRIFAPITIKETVDKMELETFSYIHEGKIIEHSFDEDENNDEYLRRIQKECLGDYDCGIFIFRKI